MKRECKKEGRECLFKPSNFKVWFIDNQWFNLLLTVILDNSGCKYKYNFVLFTNISTNETCHSINEKKYLSLNESR